MLFRGLFVYATRLLALCCGLVSCESFVLAQAAPPGVNSQQMQAQANAAAVQAGDLAVCGGALLNMNPSQQTISKASLAFGGGQSGACAGSMQPNGSSLFSTDPTTGKLAFIGGQAMQAFQQGAGAYEDKDCALEGDIDQYGSLQCSSFADFNPATLKDSSEEEAVGKYSLKQVLAEVRNASKKQACQAKLIAKSRQNLECFKSTYDKIHSAMAAYKQDIDNNLSCFNTYVSDVQGLKKKQEQRADQIDVKVQQFADAAKAVQSTIAELQKRQGALAQAIPDIRAQRSRVFTSVRQSMMSRVVECMSGAGSYDTPQRRSHCVKRAANPKDGVTGRFEGQALEECLVTKYNQSLGGLSKLHSDQNSAGDRSSFFKSAMDDVQNTLEGSATAGTTVGFCSDNAAVFNSKAGDGVNLGAAGVSAAVNCAQSIFSKKSSNFKQFGEAGQIYINEANACLQQAAQLSQSEYGGSTGLGAVRLEYEAKVRQLGTDLREANRNLNDTLMAVQKNLGVDLSQHLQTHGCVAAMQAPADGETPTMLEQRGDCLNHLSDLMIAVKDGAALPDTNGQKMSINVPGVQDPNLSMECQGVTSGGARGCRCSGLSDCGTVFSQVSTNLRQNAEQMTGNGSYVDPSCVAALCAQKPGIERTKTLANAAIKQYAQSISATFAQPQGIVATATQMKDALNAMLARIQPAVAALGSSKNAEKGGSPAVCETTGSNGFCEVPKDFGDALASASGLQTFAKEDFDDVSKGLGEAEKEANGDKKKADGILAQITRMQDSCKKSKGKKEIQEKVDVAKDDIDDAYGRCVKYGDSHDGRLSESELIAIFQPVIDSYKDLCSSKQENFELAKGPCKSFAKEIRTNQQNCSSVVSSAGVAKLLGSSLQRQERGSAKAAEINDSL